MPNYVAPGVYVEEVESGPRPIVGVPTGTAAFLGETERGSTQPRLVTSYAEYLRWYGGAFDETKFMPDVVKGFFENGGQRLYVCRVVGAAATCAEVTFGDFTVRASGPGSWGRQIWAVIGPGTTKILDADGKSLVPRGFRIRLGYWSAGTAPFDFVAEPTRLPRPIIEDFDDLVTDERSPDFYGRRFPLIDQAKGDGNQGPDSSALAQLVRNVSAQPQARPPDGSAQLVTQGTGDSNVLSAEDYAGLPAGNRRNSQGLSALESGAYREVALVYAPSGGNEIARLIVTHCAHSKSRFAAIDSPRGVGSASSLDPSKDISETEYAAFYYPWIGVPDPETGARKWVPPGGHVLGVYARTDAERGVFKPPANEVLHNVVDLETDVDDEAQRLLSSRGVNAIRRIPGNGIRIWGARTLSSDSLWKYVSVRRFLIFLERSVYAGTQWVVFEPNDKRLWAKLTNTIRSFLIAQWHRGALPGRTERDAFFVSCDETTMTRDDILNGRLICQIGVAPVRPAEFVIFRLCQKTAEARS